MNTEFGKFIRTRRIEKSISAKELAKMTGQSSSYISSIENGNRSAPTQAILEKIADALSLDKGERLLMLDLAANSKTKPTIAVDLVNYINQNRVVKDVLRFAKENQIDSEDWIEFLDCIKRKYE